MIAGDPSSLRARRGTLVNAPLRDCQAVRDSVRTNALHIMSPEDPAEQRNALREIRAKTLPVAWS